MMTTRCALLLTLLALVVIPLGCRKQTPSNAVALTWQATWDDAAQQAKTEKRPLLIMFKTEWCPYCKYIDEHIFPQPAVTERLQRFVLLHLDGDRADVQPLMEKYHIQGFPTFVILDTNGKELLRFNDINDHAEIIDLLDGIAAANPGLLELGKARALVDAGDDKGAVPLYEKAYALLKTNHHPAAEKALLALAEKTKDEHEKTRAYLHEFLESYPASASLPEVYASLAALYSSPILAREFREKAAGLIEERLHHWDAQNEEVRRVTLDQHVDLLVDLYAHLDRQAAIPLLYAQAARLSEKAVDTQGGLARNHYLIGAVAYNYRKAGEAEKALAFLNRAAAELPDYWPVYSASARASIDLGKFTDAVNQASRGYELAEEISKPKVAIVWADALAGEHHYEDAIDVLKRAANDLQKLGTEKGRAKRVAQDLEKRRAEYEAVAAAARTTQKTN